MSSTATPLDVPRQRADWMTQTDEAILETIRDEGNTTPLCMDANDIGCQYARDRPLAYTYHALRNMYENILIPYDGSEGATEVLHHASELAHWADATIHVLYVADTTRDSVTVIEDPNRRRPARHDTESPSRATSTRNLRRLAVTNRAPLEPRAFVLDVHLHTGIDTRYSSRGTCRRYRIARVTEAHSILPRGI